MAKQAVKNTVKRWKMNDEETLVEDVPAGTLPLEAPVRRQYIAWPGSTW